MPVTEINGTAIHYHDTGEGIPIVFIHPPLLTRTVFVYQSEQLSDEFRIITFDVRGHGYSPYSFKPITYSLIVEDIKQLLDKLNIEKAYIAGYSTGGSIALEMLLSYPERCLGGILLSTMPETSDAWLSFRIKLAAWLCSKKMKTVIAWAITWGNADNRKSFQRLYHEAKHGNVKNWEQYYRCSLAYKATDRLFQIKHRMLLVFGKKDTSFHRYARKLKQNLPNFTFHLLSGQKHQLPTKSAAELNEQIKKWIREEQR